MVPNYILGKLTYSFGGKFYKVFVRFETLKLELLQVVFLKDYCLTSFEIDSYTHIVLLRKCVVYSPNNI